MADVILFRPKESYSDLLGSRPPLGLLYVAAPLLEAGLSVRLIDTGTCRDWQAALREELTASTVCAGVTVMTGHQIRGALEFARAVRAVRPVPVVWGGLHPSLLPEQTMEHPDVDMVLAGEGEVRFLELVRRLQRGDALDTLPGLFFRRDGQVVATPPVGAFLDMNGLPMPAYDLIDTSHYVARPPAFAPHRQRCIDLNTDRGCPSQCRFCYNLRFNRGRWRAMKAERVLAAIEHVVGRYGLDAVNFVADNFFVDPRRTRAICQGIVDRGLDISWHSDIRIDSFLRYDDELLRLMKASGCTTLTFGVESGSPRVLEQIRKDITVEQVVRADERARRFGFHPHYHFMVGFPDETARDVRHTLRLIARLGRSGRAVIHGPSMFMPYPGTPLFDRCLELGYQPPQDLEQWSRHDWNAVSKLPWFSARYKGYLREVADVGVEAYGGLLDGRAGHRLRRGYFRLRFAGLTRGMRLANADIRAARGLKRLLAG